MANPGKQHDGASVRRRSAACAPRCLSALMMFSDAVLRSACLYARMRDLSMILIIYRHYRLHYLLFTFSLLLFIIIVHIIISCREVSECGAPMMLDVWI